MLPFASLIEYIIAFLLQCLIKCVHVLTLLVAHELVVILEPSVIPFVELLRRHNADQLLHFPPHICQPLRIDLLDDSARLSQGVLDLKKPPEVGELTDSRLVRVYSDTD